ncbi:MAG: hypothetical protein KAF27_10815 [Porphyrobacter sp.]|nr:hypothetical protein [Porphyrobacter sp.]
MTGIVAIFAAGPACEHQLGRMMSAMDERVRDESGVWRDGSFAMGAVVLHATGESLEAALPLANAQGNLVLVMDGYLTNWEELRGDLLERGAALRNRSDAELVLHAYEQWGEDCAGRLEGEFAIVIADLRHQRLYALRDHQGLRPLYIYKDKDAVLVASDIAAIIAAATRKPEPDLDYLANIVSGHWYLRDRTVWKGLGRVPPAHWLSHDRQGQTLRRYYSVPVDIDLSYRREQDYVDHYREVLFDAVRRTSRSHRTLAVTVSGGLDSSSLYCIAHALEQQGRLPAPGLQGYTLAGDPGTAAYELPYARAAAEHCGRSLIEVPLFRPGIDWFTARGAADCDVPLPQNGAMTIGLERRAHEDGARAWMDGHGGDQWLDGTREYYTEFAKAFDLAGFFAALRRDAGANGWGHTLPDALRFAAGAFVPMALRRAKRRRAREARYRDPSDLFWMQPAWRERLLGFEDDYLSALPEQARAQGNWNRLLSPYNCYAFDFLQRQRGASGVDSREPMLTRQFIAFCARAPKWVLNQGGLTKVVHRKAMRGIMPDLIVDRTDKAEFSDFAIMRDFARHALSASPGALDPLCDPAGLRRLTAFESELGIDPARGWELWGCYAVAAFMNSGL